MTVKEFNKNVVLKTLDLTYDKMPLFDALTNRRFYADRQIIKFFTKSESDNLYLKISQYLKQLKSPIILSKVVEEIFAGSGQNSNQVLDLIDSYIKTYETRNISVKWPGKAQSNFNSFLFEIQENLPLVIPMPYLDDFPKNGSDFVDLIAPICQKITGIVFLVKGVDELRKLEIKKSHVDLIRFVGIHPVFPEGKLLGVFLGFLKKGKPSFKS
jgi:hypothetical protein